MFSLLLYISINLDFFFKARWFTLSWPIEKVDLLHFSGIQTSRSIYTYLHMPTVSEHCKFVWICYLRRTKWIHFFSKCLTTDLSGLISPNLNCGPTWLRAWGQNKANTKWEFSVIPHFSFSKHCTHTERHTCIHTGVHRHKHTHLKGCVVVMLLLTVLRFCTTIVTILKRSLSCCWTRISTQRERKWRCG